MSRKTLLLFLLTLLVFSPFVILPQLLFERNNDLFGSFYPLSLTFFGPIKEFGQIPFWQHGIMGGSPIVGDPIQMGYFYPFSFLALVFPFSLFSTLFYVFHVCLAGWFGYMFCRKVWGLTRLSSFASAFMYMFSLQMFARIEAGHITLAAAIAWAPLFFFSLSQLFARQNLNWAGILAFSAGMLFLVHLPYLIFCALVGSMYGLMKFIKTRNKKRAGVVFIASCLLFVVLVLPHLLALIQLVPLTTRNILTDEVNGQSIAWRIFLAEVFFPFYYGLNSFHEEAAFFVGFGPLLLSIIGFFRLSNWQKIGVAVLVMGIALFVLESKTPVYPFLSSHLPFISMIRVPSKSWFLINGIVAVMGGIGFEYLSKRLDKRITHGLLILIFIELTTVGYLRLNKPTAPVYDKSREPLYAYVGREKGFYRLYCPTLCLSEDEIIRKGKGLTGGYNGVQLASYASFAHNAGGYAFGSYSSFIPPYQTFVDKPQPKAIELGILSTRYVVSPYLLSDESLVLEKIINNYNIYRNAKEKPYVYWTDGISEKPLRAQFNGREIAVEIPKGNGNVIVSEPYYPAWKAYLGARELPLRKDNGIIMSVAIPRDVQDKNNKLLLSYEPPGYPYTFVISTIGYLVIIVIIVLHNKKKYG